ncbi:MAG: prepilin-type N-terminal cleavage/methylation domain-containing protein [Pirellulales bacterium]|nr:prepilin-type N-terminal cleavage/methylation domain-containing protein [Pirellulales bacterium]
MRHRHGYMLVELLTAMTIGSVLLAVATGLLLTVLRIDRAARERAGQRIALGRLSEQFRRDVRAATAMARPDAPEGAEFLREPDHTVTYQAEDGYLVRTERRDGAVRQQEAFRLPSGTTALMETRDDVEPAIVSLRIVDHPATESANAQSAKPLARPTVRVDAALARDHRFLTSREGPLP